MGKRIVVINDNQTLIDLFAEILTEEGHGVVMTFCDTYDLQTIERVQPDIILLDCIIQSGDCSGSQIIQKLKLRRSTMHIPIVLCTAATNMLREIEGHLVSKGITIIRKPFDIDDLLAGVEQAGARIPPEAMRASGDGSGLLPI